MGIIISEFDAGFVIVISFYAFVAVPGSTHT